MADFNLNLSDLDDSKSITSAMKQSFYPENQQVIQNTSSSQSNNFDRTLMSRDVTKIMQGDALYRNPAFALAGYEQNTKATMHTILAMGADIDDSVSVPDPDNPGEKLTGAEARLEIARKSLLGTGFSPQGFESSMQAFVSQSISETINGPVGESSTGAVTGLSGESVPHNTQGYSTADSAQVFNGGNRAIAVVDQLSDQEKQQYITKAEKLTKKKNLAITSGDAAIFKSGFDLNFNSNSKNQTLKDLNFAVYQSGSYVSVNGQMQWQTESIDKSLFGTGARRCMPSAALMELLDRLTDSIYINGGLGVGRGIIGPNFSELSQDNNSVSDHSFGRGFDVYAVGQSEASLTRLDNPVPSAEQYMKALGVLLDYIQALPQELHPDLIMVSDQLANELGIIDGLELGTAPVRKKYSNLSKSLNFGSDSSHRNHIHISFGAKRAGAILPSVSISKASTSDTENTQVTPTTTSVEKFKKSYTLQDGTLSDVDVFILLNQYGNFSEEISSIFTAIAQRESSYSPSAINRQGFWGMWQIGTTIDSGGGTVANFPVPTEERLPFWKLAFANWKEMGITKDNFKEFHLKYRFSDTANAGRDYFDKRTFIPLNQVIALRAKFGETTMEKRFTKLGASKGTSLLHPYGEGFLYFGWLSGVSWNTAKSIYKKMTGRSEDVLSDWLTKEVAKDSRTRNIDPITGKTILQSWIDGKSYSILYKEKNETTNVYEYNPPTGWPKAPTPN